MENKIYDYIIENYGINGWDYYKGADEDEKKEMLEGMN
jgi:hypothetical protein|tara:strand:- start:38 stop:151 length:114 start_codon:yes stop_codon:yes gene_type:complete